MLLPGSWSLCPCAGRGPDPVRSRGDRDLVWLSAQLPGRPEVACISVCMWRPVLFVPTSFAHPCASLCSVACVHAVMLSVGRPPILLIVLHWQPAVFSLRFLMRVGLARSPCFAPRSRHRVHIHDPSCCVYRFRMILCPTPSHAPCSLGCLRAGFVGKATMRVARHSVARHNVARPSAPVLPRLQLLPPLRLRPLRLRALRRTVILVLRRQMVPPDTGETRTMGSEAVRCRAPVGLACIQTLHVYTDIHPVTYLYIYIYIYMCVYIHIDMVGRWLGG